MENTGIFTKLQIENYQHCYLAAKTGQWNPLASPCKLCIELFVRHSAKGCGDEAGQYAAVLIHKEECGN